MSDTFIDQSWDRIVPVLEQYIRIPNKSPAFDPEWEAHGHMERAVALVRDWLAAADIDGIDVSVHRLPGRTPVIVCEIPATTTATTGTVLLYGHLDKQPEMEGWFDGFGPWEPRIEGDRLYGRGGADDGYAAFAARTAIEAVRNRDRDHARCVILIEASEESGSPDLPAYIEALDEFLGDVELVVCLDSSCADYERLWTSTSLRGLVQSDLRVEVLTEGVHSGASGVVPSSFRILRSLLSRIEDEATGRVLVPSMQAEIPAERIAQAQQVAELLDIAEKYPWAGTTQPVTDDRTEMILAQTWRAALSVTGLSGAPLPVDAGNVLRPQTTAKLSMRLPPLSDSDVAMREMTEMLTTDVSYGATVIVSAVECANGWNAPATAPWLADEIASASQRAFGQPPGAMGIGGSIPFMAMLGERYPSAQFVVTGVLGPESNAHGPNEFLDVPTARRVTACVSDIVAAHAEAPSPGP
ncbi:MAG: M20/M25/M40 family metallo-hydrolase [Acidimicrobiales bacterium]|nr:M20/M25/M40 family metallo-hydrolase [Acidimicrobiales bacterium]